MKLCGGFSGLSDGEQLLKGGLKGTPTRRNTNQIITHVPANMHLTAR